MSCANHLLNQVIRRPALQRLGAEVGTSRRDVTAPFRRGTLRVTMSFSPVWHDCPDASGLRGADARGRASLPKCATAQRRPLALLLSIVLILVSPTAWGQPGQAPPLDPQLQLMLTQPPIEIATNVEVAATFDPPMIRPGEKSTYRVTFSALEDSVRWPEKIVAPPELNLRANARGQLLLPGGAKLKPLTAINYHARPATNGSFTVSQFEVEVYGRRVTVPAARLDVVTDPRVEIVRPFQLDVEVIETNIYSAQPIGVRVLMRSAAANVMQGLSNLKLSGDGFLVDQGFARQTISMMPYQGRPVATYQYETSVTPLMSGNLTLTAQGFTAGNQFSGPVAIQGNVTIPGGTPQYLLVDSDPVTVTVRPLPQTGKLPGFTGAIGSFSCDPPILATNRVRVGDLVTVSVIFRGDGNLSRLIPPPQPTSIQWQTFAAVPGGVTVPPIAIQPPNPNSMPGGSAAFHYTMIPIESGITSTPAIPFSYFDPKKGAYVDLTIPPVPIIVTGDPATLAAQSMAKADLAVDPAEKKLALSSLATAPGRSTGELVPLQQRKVFLLVQTFPVLLFLGLWAWDRRRRYLEQNPDILIRRRARRALRREKRALQSAFQAGDAVRCARIAAGAMREGAAPHFTAEPRALVCRDILNLLPENGSERSVEVVRRFFAVADASHFSTSAADAASLLALQPDVERVLEALEAKL